MAVSLSYGHLVRSLRRLCVRDNDSRPDPFTTEGEVASPTVKVSPCLFGAHSLVFSCNVTRGQGKLFPAGSLGAIERVE